MTGHRWWGEETGVPKMRGIACWGHHRALGDELKLSLRFSEA